MALLVTVPTSEQVMDQAERLECAVKYVGPAGSACWPDPAGPRIMKRRRGCQHASVKEKIVSIFQM